MNPLSKAFTLVETLVAISIIAIAFGGPYIAVRQSLNASYNARDELSATMLAQEAIEYVYNVRDTNYIQNSLSPSGKTWLYEFDGTQGTNCFANKCTIDPTPTAPLVQVCPQGVCTALNLGTGYFYRQTSGGTQTPFTRSIQFTWVSAPDEAKVVSTVSWTTEHIPHTISTTEYLSNWLTQ